jgi:hypothetical protein
MKSFIFCATFFIVFSLFSQNETDAIRYSQENLGSTARSFAVGGAFGAVGADPSSAAINPAGLAKYRSSKLYISTAFYNAKNKTTFLGNNLTDNKFNFNLPNLSLIINIPGEDYTSKNPKGFVNFIVGFNVNRKNNFHNKILFEGINEVNSITQDWVERANSNGFTPNQMSAYSLEHLAYVTSAIDPDTLSPTPKYVSAYGNNPIRVNQSGLVQSKGALNDYNLSVAANYRHIIQGGISIGFKSIRYIESYSFIEKDLKTGTVKDIKSLTLDKDFSTKGRGLNAKIGVLVSPSEFFRFGFAYHSPTIYNLTDSYTYTLNAIYDYGARDIFNYDRVNTVATTQPTIYRYKITTPSRQVLSAAMLSKEIGFVSIDLEFVNYAGASLWAKDDKFIPENTNINRNYNSVMNLRMGAELIQDDFRFRAGYARYPSPYKSNMVSDLKAMVNNVYTLGFGIKTDSYSFDIAYVNSGNNTAYPPYELNNKKQPMANNVVRTSNLILTAGFNID